MKKVLLTVLLVLGLSSYVSAGDTGGADWDKGHGKAHDHGYSTPDAVQAVAGVKVDAPNLVKLSTNFSLGVEAGKDVIANPFGSREYIEDDHGYFGYLKVTYTGSLLDLSK